MRQGAGQALGSAYLRLVALGAIGCVVAAASNTDPSRAASPLLACELVLLAALAQHFPLPVGPQHKVNVGLGVHFAALLLLDPPAAIILVGCGQLLGEATLALRREPRTGRRRRGVRGMLFNTSQFILATAAGTVMFGLLLPHRGPAPLDRVQDLWALPATAVALYLTNYLAVAAMVGLQTGQAPAWWDNLRAQAPEFGGLLFLGLVTALAGGQHAWAPLAVAVPTAVVYLAQKRVLRLHTEQLETIERLRDLRTRLEASEREHLVGEERQRIARELHDRVEQTFFSIELQAKAALRAGTPAGPLRSTLALVGDHASRGREQLREAIFALGRAEVREHELIRALRRLVRDFQQRTGLESDLVVTGAERRVPPGTAEVLHAVAREALTNVERHARSGAVVLSLQFDEDAVTLSVQDDGVGPALLVLRTLESSATHFGLRDLRRQVELTGGAFSSGAGQDGGFVVRARVPLASRAEAAG